MSTMTRNLFAVGVLLWGAVATPRHAHAQPPVPLHAGTTLFQLDLSQVPVGEFPSSLEMLKGIMEVAMKNGVPMLKASAPSEFRISLPQGQVLPRDFTLEFDLVPKLGSNPQDFSVEGTPTIDQGVGSAHVLWHATGYLSVIGGGGDTYETPMPEDLRATLPGVLTKVVVEVEGPTIRLATNGRRLFTLQKQFARGAVLRVFLGAQDGRTEAVYLAGLRVIAGTGLGITAAAGLPSQQPGVVGNPGATPGGVGNPVASAPTPAPGPVPSPATALPAATPPAVGGTVGAITGTGGSGGATGASSGAGASSAGSTGGSSPIAAPAGPGKTPPTTKTKSLCAPASPTPGRAPYAVTATAFISPAGGEIVWDAVPGAAGYAVERGPTGGATPTRIASSCDAPALFIAYTDATAGMQMLRFRDASGGVLARVTYTYVVHAYGPTGAEGWNSGKWTAPTMPFLNGRAQSNGSTVQLHWDLRDTDPNTGKLVPKPQDFLITSDYGFTLVKSRGSFTGCGCYLDVLGVPLGDHTFTITARWPPDVTRRIGLPVTVSP